MVRSGGLLALALATSACLSFPTGGTDAGATGDGGGATDAAQGGCGSESLDGNVLTMQSGQYVVDNDVYRIVFHPAVAYSPSELRRSSALADNLLYDESSPVLERLIGVVNFNQDALHMDLGSDPAVLTVVADGPAVVQVRVAGTTVTDIEHDTLFTLYPDGRIHRDVLVTVPDQSGGTHLVSYIALDPALFSHFDSTFFDNGSGTRVMLGGGGTPLGTDNEAGDVSGYACAFHEQSGVRIGWTWFVDAAASVGPRYSESSVGGDYTIALQHDWHRGGQVPGGSYEGQYLIHVGDTDAAAPDECKSLQQIADAFQAPPAFSGDDAPVYDPTAGNYTVTSDGTLPISFASIGGLSTPSAYRITGSTLDIDAAVVRAGEQTLTRGFDYLIQEESNGDRWMFLNCPLGDGDTVTIEVGS